MSKRKKTAAVIDSDSDESDSGSNLDEVCSSFTNKWKILRSVLEILFLKLKKTIISKNEF